MATMQHHDAVTGTEKQHVAEDYAMRLAKGSKAVTSFMGPTLFDKAAGSYFAATPTYEAPGGPQFWCPLLIISQCSYSETEQDLEMVVYNPLSKYVWLVYIFSCLFTFLVVFI